MDPGGMLLQDFGQRVDLTRRIREVLANCPEGTTSLRELIQNADDARASRARPWHPLPAGPGARAMAGPRPARPLRRRLHRRRRSLLAPALVQWHLPHRQQQEGLPGLEDRVLRVAALQFGDFYNMQYVKMYTFFMLQLLFFLLEQFPMHMLMVPMQNNHSYKIWHSSSLPSSRRRRSMPRSRRRSGRRRPGSAPGSLLDPPLDPPQGVLLDPVLVLGAPERRRIRGGRRRILGKQGRAKEKQGLGGRRRSRAWAGAEDGLENFQILAEGGGRTKKDDERIPIQSRGSVVIFTAFTWSEGIPQRLIFRYRGSTTTSNNVQDLLWTRSMIISWSSS